MAPLRTASWLAAVLLPHLAVLAPSTATQLRHGEGDAAFPARGTAASSLANVSAAATGAVPWSYANPSEGCLKIPATLCLRNANRTRGVVLTAGAKLPALAAAWTFDDGAPLDASGNGRHIPHAVAAGPGRRGAGQSALFPPGDFATIPGAAPPLNASKFALSFWLFLIEDEDGGGGGGGGSSGFAAPAAEGVEAWRTVLRKGADKHTSSPGLFLWPRSRRLRVKYQMRSGAAGGLDSHGNLPARRWHHVALVVDGRVVQLYVNGILDAEAVSADGVAPNAGPLYVGGDPWGAEMRGSHACLVDDLKVWHSGDFTTDVLLAEAAGALGALSPTAYRLGCLDCAADAAASACARLTQPTFHACSRDEYRSGGLEVMHAQGWRWTRDALGRGLWTAEALLDGGGGGEPRRPGERRAVLCCVN